MYTINKKHLFAHLYIYNKHIYTIIYKTFSMYRSSVNTLFTAQLGNIQNI